jgi:multiple sugar transport system substrate-binding protein
MKRAHRLRILPAAALVVAAAAVPTLGSFVAKPANAASTITLRFASFLSPTEKTEFQNDIYPTFHKQYPNVNVSFEAIPDSRVKAITQIAAGTGADVTNLGDGDVLFYADKKALKDLVPYVGRSFINQYLPATINIGKVGSKQYALPKDYSSVAVYYNKALFKAAGLALPGAGFTWQQFRSDALALSKKSGSWSVELSPDWSRLADAVVRSLGGSLISSDGKHVVGYMDSAATVKAVTFYTNLVTKDHVVPTPAQYTAATNGGADPFAQGKVGLEITGIWPSPTYDTIKGLSYGVAPFPVTAGVKPTNTICFAGFGVAATTKYTQQAVALVKLLSGPVGDAVWGKAGLPSVKSVADSQHNDATRTAFINAVKVDTVLPGDITGPDAAAAVGSTIQEGLDLIDNNPGTSVQQVLSIEARKGQQELANYASGQ